MGASSAVDDWQDVPDHGADDWQDVDESGHSDEGGFMAAMRGATQGETAGFADELMAAQSVAGRRLGKGAVALLSGKGFDAAAHEMTAPGVVDEYTHLRDEERARNRAAQEAHGGAYLAGELGGAAASSMVPGVGQLGTGKTLLGAVGGGAAYGAAQGLGSSEADLTKGDVGRAALDTGVGGLAGAAAGAVGHGLGKVVGWIGDKARAGIRGAEADAAAQANAAAQKAFRSARGSLGGEAAAALHAVDMAEQIASNASGHYTPAQAAEAAAWLKTPEVAALRQNAAGNVLEAGQNRIPGSLATARQIFEQARQGISPEAVEAGAAERLQDPVGRQILPRVKNYAARAIPPIVGAAVGGIPGAILGFGAGAVMGNPGTSLANAMRNPAVRRMAWGLVESGSSALGRFGPYLQRVAATAGVQLAQEIHERLLDTDPDYQAKVAHGLQEASQVEPTPEGP